MLDHKNWSGIGGIGQWVSVLVGIITLVVTVYIAQGYMAPAKQTSLGGSPAITPVEEETFKHIGKTPYITVKLDTRAAELNQDEIFRNMVKSEIVRLTPMFKQCFEGYSPDKDQDATFTIMVEEEDSASKVQRGRINSMLAAIPAEKTEMIKDILAYHSKWPLPHDMSRGTFFYVIQFTITITPNHGVDP